MLPQPDGLLKLMLNLLHTITIHRRKLFLRNFINYVCDISLCPSAYDPVCSKLGMMLDITKLYSVLPVLMTLTCTQAQWES